jgi:hypothetical protein
LCVLLDVCVHVFFWVQIDGKIDGSGHFDASVVGSGHRTLIAHLCRYYELHHVERMLRQWQRVGCKFLEMRGISIGLRDVEQFGYMEQPLRHITMTSRSRKEWSQRAEALWLQESSKALPTTLDRMVQSGAKGNKDTLRSFRGFVGLVPVHQSATVPIVDFMRVPEFHPYNEGVLDCSLTGGKNEYAHFIEAQKHRDELRRGAKSTPEAGYKQRQVEVTAESSILHHDLTVRMRNGKIIQFLYGGTGWNPQHLVRGLLGLAPRDCLPFDAYELYRQHEVAWQNEAEMGSLSMAQLKRMIATLVRVCTQMAWLDERKVEEVMRSGNAEDSVVGRPVDKMITHLTAVLEKLFATRQQLPTHVVHEWVKGLIKAHRLAFVPPGAAVGLWASSAFMPFLLQFGISLGKHGAGTSAMSGLERASAILMASKKQRAPCVVVEVTRDDLDWIAYWKRVRLADWNARVDVGHVQKDLWIRAEDVAWRAQVIMPDDIHVGFRVAIERDREELPITDDEYHSYMKQLLKYLKTAPNLLTWLKGGQFRLELVDSAGAYDAYADEYDIPYALSRPFVAYLAFAGPNASSKDLTGMRLALLSTLSALQNYRIAGWNEIERIEKLAPNRYALHGIPGASKAHSIDILRVMKLPGVNANACHMTDIHAMVRLFDIEAVREYIFKTLYTIFASQDSSRYFDPGPFAFAADYETRTGLPSPYASNTLEDDKDSGPLKKAGLDQAFSQLTKASFFGLEDRLDDPAASCMVGRPIRIGSEWSEIRVDPDKLAIAHRPYDLQGMRNASSLSLASQPMQDDASSYVPRSPEYPAPANTSPPYVAGAVSPPYQVPLEGSGESKSPNYWAAAMEDVAALEDDHSSTYGSMSANLDDDLDEPMGLGLPSAQDFDL